MMMQNSCGGSRTTWYKVAGYNDGAPFQAYTDVSVDGQSLLVFHHQRYDGEVRHEQPTANSFSGFGTAGWGNSFRLSNVATLLEALCPSSTAGSARFYIGQHNIDGSEFSSAGNLNWIAFTDKVGSSFVDMFDSYNPSANQFSGSGIRRGDGTTNGAYVYTSGHGTTQGVHQMATASTVNANTIFEWSAPYGSDPNHGWSVWSNGAGSYYNGNRPGSTSRFGWMGVSGC